jgi:hypothetical protein
MENVTSNPDVQIISRAEESDSRLLAALDEAIAKADATPGQGHSSRHVRARLDEYRSDPGVALAD